MPCLGGGVKTGLVPGVAGTAATEVAKDSKLAPWGSPPPNEVANPNPGTYAPAA